MFDCRDSDTGVLVVRRTTTQQVAPCCYLKTRMEKKADEAGARCERETRVPVV